MLNALLLNTLPAEHLARWTRDGFAAQGVFPVLEGDGVPAGVARPWVGATRAAVGKVAVGKVAAGEVAVGEAVGVLSADG